MKEETEVRVMKGIIRSIKRSTTDIIQVRGAHLHLDSITRSITKREIDLIQKKRKAKALLAKSEMPLISQETSMEVRSLTMKRKWSKSAKKRRKNGSAREKRISKIGLRSHMNLKFSLLLQVRIL